MDVRRQQHVLYFFLSSQNCCGGRCIQSGKYQPKLRFKKKLTKEEIQCVTEKENKEQSFGVIICRFTGNHNEERRAGNLVFFSLAGQEKINASGRRRIELS
jgi:hypothetical protein